MPIFYSSFFILQLTVTAYFSAVLKIKLSSRKPSDKDVLFTALKPSLCAAASGGAGVELVLAASQQNLNHI